MGSYSFISIHGLILVSLLILFFLLYFTPNSELGEGGVDTVGCGVSVCERSLYCLFLLISLSPNHSTAYGILLVLSSEAMDV